VSAQGLSLTVAAKPENLAVIRQALAGYADAMGFDSDAIADLKTVVSEACMNVVVHAYPEDAAGPLEIGAEPDEDGLEISVRDRGAGFRPRPADVQDSGLRLGLPLIATLSDEFEVRGGGAGTEVRVKLRFSRNGDEQSVEEVDYTAEGTLMSIAAGAFVRPVLARVIGALAARADFSVDRLSDTILIGDAVSAHDASDFREGTVGIELSDGAGWIGVRIGPLVEGGGERIVEGLELPGGTSLSKLASDVSIKRERVVGGDYAEFVLVRIDR
jgi:serine/threonine-protein kinase RsbW